MKNIFLFICLIPTVLFGQLELPYSIKILNPKPLDGYYFNTSGTIYTNTAQVLSQVTSPVRYRGQTFNVNGVEYWFNSGILDGNLVIKGSGITNTAGNNELMKSDATNAVPSGLFSTTLGNLDLGSSSISGATRTISAPSSGNDTGLDIQIKYSGTLGSVGTFSFDPSTGNSLFTPSSVASGVGISPLIIERNSASTSSVINTLMISGATSGTPANGTGTSLLFRTKTGSGKVFSSYIESVSTDVTSTSEDFDLVFKNMAGGAAATEKFRIASTGAIGLSGANYGTTNQVLTSNGSGSPATWTTIGGGITGLTTNRFTYASSSTSIANTKLDYYNPSGNANVILNTTIDGSDDGAIAINGGGSNSSARGSQISLYGNEVGTTSLQGNVAITGGDSPRGGSIYLTGGSAASTIGGDIWLSAGPSQIGSRQAFILIDNGTSTFYTPDIYSGSRVPSLVPVYNSGSLNNGLAEVMRVVAKSSSTPVAGYGATIGMAAQTGASNHEMLATINAVLTDVTSTSEDADVVISNMTAGSYVTEKLRITSTGVVQASGHFKGGSSTPSTSLGAGAGSGGPISIAVSGTDTAGKITLTTGSTAPTGSTAIVTLTLSSIHASAPYMILSPANDNAAALSGTGQVRSLTTSSTAVVQAGATALASSTQYIWFYHIIE